MKEARLDFSTSSYSVGPHPRGGNLRSIISVRDTSGESFIVGSFFGLEKKTLTVTSQVVVEALVRAANEGRL
jgi:hypothetical protein